jgi:SAM-dependent methyltransferase
VQVDAPERRLDRFWGVVDHRHNAEISRRVTHGPVLDVGCGYGTLTGHLAELGIECTGVDSDASALAIARARFPAGSFVNATADVLPFLDGSFATVVMRDSLHHLINEPNWSDIRRELLRVLDPAGRIVVFDPNIIGILRVARVFARHKDETCSVDRARGELGGMGLRVQDQAFNTILSLPLSGGYVGVELVPPRPRVLHRLVMGLELTLERALARVNLLPRLSWRYLLVADR